MRGCKQCQAIQKAQDAGLALEEAQTRLEVLEEEALHQSFEMDTTKTHTGGT